MAPTGLRTLRCLAAAAAAAGASYANPFLDQHFYINPVNAKEYEASIATASGTTRRNLEKMQTVPSAYWIDKKSKIRGSNTTTVEGILKDASAKSPPELVVLIFYDLPNRDCDAKASNGEICCSKNSDGTCDYMAPGDCAEGIEEYKSGYVDHFVSVLSEYDGKLPIVLVMEPDGLANLATNIADPHCGNEATQRAYKAGVKYAVEQIAEHAPSVSLYLDAAHGGWLGWENNLEKFMGMLKELDLPFRKIRGFATNVANYQALGVQCPWCPDQGYRNGYCMNGKHRNDPCCEDPCSLISQWNFGNNELNYAAGLVAAADDYLGMEAHVIIDTGRNGVADQRQNCANWCNPRGAGAGVPSTTDTANTSLVDAYFWLKTPGESDGCSETLPSGSKCPRFDAKCASVDSLGVRAGEARAPEAGLWFDFQVKQLAENARFEAPIGKGDATCPKSAQTAQPVAPPMVTIPISSGAALGGNTSSSGPCAGAYQQCGGANFNGPTCCQAGCQCVDNGGGGYYSQCTPLDPSAGGVCSSGGPQPSQGNTVASSALPAAATGPAAAAGAARLGRPVASWAFPSSGVAVPAPLPQGPATPAAAGAAPATRPGAPQQVPIAPGQVPSAQWPLAAVPLSVPQNAALGSAQRSQPVQQPLKAAQATQAPTTAPPTAPPAAPAQPRQPTVQQCAAPYGQCGGSDWKGPTCCDVYCSCQVVSAAKSHCVPTSGAFSQVGLAGPPSFGAPSHSSAIAVVLKDEVDGARGPLAVAGAGAVLWAALPLALALAAMATGLAMGAGLRRWRSPGSYAVLDRRALDEEPSTGARSSVLDADIA